MSLLSLKQHFQHRRPLIQVVLDGWGIGESNDTNAIHQAQLPTMQKLLQTCPHTQLKTHGTYVGLPSDKDLGGSEVGHMTMGAGQVIAQGPTEIQRLLQSGDFFKSPALEELIQNCLQHQKPLHLLGLLSDGNIHSHISHFEAIIEHAFQSNVQQLYVHALLDGRDVPIQSALDYTERLEALFAKLKQQNNQIDYAFASGGGRESITMDRDQNWAKIEQGWNLHVHGKADHAFESIQEAIEHFREQNPNIIDQAIPGFVIHRNGEPVATVQDHHSFIFVNFRPDRAIEFTQAMERKDFSEFDRGDVPKVLFAGMRVYDQDTNEPQRHIIGTTNVENPFGKRILEAGLSQFRLTETQKYAHVTFFFNGGYKDPLDSVKETYCLIPSDSIPSFDAKPQMKAFEIAQKAQAFILSKQHDFGLINFANADMVGHSGTMNATIQAVEAVDQALGTIVDAIQQVSGVLIVTADHGNADQMLSYNKKLDRWEPNTKHSLNPVPFVIYDPLYEGQYSLKSHLDHDDLTLSQIAATSHMILGLPVPSDIDEPLFVI